MTNIVVSGSSLLAGIEVHFRETCMSSFYEISKVRLKDPCGDTLCPNIPVIVSELLLIS